MCKSLVNIQHLRAYTKIFTNCYKLAKIEYSMQKISSENQKFGHIIGPTNQTNNLKYIYLVFFLGDST